MAIKNPFPPTEKQYTFKRTFLRDVELNIAFEEFSFIEKRKAIEDFLNSTFGLNLSFVDSSEFGGISVFSENEGIRYIFSRDRVSVKIKSALYNSYKNSLEPCLDILLSFLNLVGIEFILDLTIAKDNLWNATTENADKVWKQALKQTFKKSEILELAKTSLPKEAGNSYKLSKKADINFEGGNSKIKFSVEIKDDTNFIFNMNITGSIGNVRVASIKEDASVLNDIIFHIFIDLVSDNILDLMQKEQ